MKSLLIISLLIPIISLSQTKTVTVAKDKIGPITCSVKYDIDLSTNKKGYWSLFLWFQNEEYSYITSSASILFIEGQEKNISLFIDDLKKAKEEMGKKQTIKWVRDNYSIILYDFSKQMYLRESGIRDGYTTLDKKYVQKLIEWLEKNAFSAQTEIHFN